MGSFLLTPMTRFYAEALQNMKSTAGPDDGGQANGTSAGNGVSGQSGGTGIGMKAEGVKEGNKFADAVQEKLSQKDAASYGSAGPVTGRNEALVQAMSREEYKQYIYQKIASIPMHPSQKWDTVSVHISEEGFAAMQEDPSYEKWVLDTLRKDFAAYNPWSTYTGGSYRVHYFGADRKEYRTESFSMGFRNGLFQKEERKGILGKTCTET